MAGGTGPFRESVDGDPAVGNPALLRTGSAQTVGISPQLKLSLCLLKHHGMKTYGGDEV
jgi:hypothetical protein